MIEIKPVENITICQPLLGEFTQDAGTFVLAATDGDVLAGAGVLQMAEGYAVITRIVTAKGYEMLDYAIGKAVLNFIERRGTMEVVCRLPELERLLQRMGFFREEREWKLNLDGYFSVHC